MKVHIYFKRVDKVYIFTNFASLLLHLRSYIYNTSLSLPHQSLRAFPLSSLIVHLISTPSFSSPSQSRCGIRAELPCSVALQGLRMER